MIKKAMLTNLFKGFTIQRWNDKIRTVTLTEIDKNAHKMVIAYCIGKYEETKHAVNWENLIKGGVYEYFRRVTTSDIKSPVYRKIVNNAEAYKELNDWIFNKWKHILPEEIKSEFERFLFNEEGLLDPLSVRILRAAHIYASYWEFNIIKNANPDGYQIKEIDKLILEDIYKYMDLEGINRLITRQMPSNFIDLSGQLRFQVRWSQTPRIPETSVLGHCMYVAILSYLFSRSIAACPKRSINNFFGGLFHDLPEALTRDIISPVKTAIKQMPLLIQQIEAELAEKELYNTIEETWKEEIKYFITDDDKSKIVIDGKVEHPSSEEITSKYNSDEYKPLDGELVKAADHMAAFVEAWYANATGIHTEELMSGLFQVKEKYKDKVIAGIDFSSIYEDFPLVG